MSELYDCAARKPVASSRLRAVASGMFALLALTLFPPIAQAAIFDDGNDRKILFDLRLKPESSLTDEERMILRAADRRGNVGFCNRAAGNATLIDYFGRPAIVTSAQVGFLIHYAFPKELIPLNDSNYLFSATRS